MICYGENTGVGDSLHAELSGAMRAIEIANTHQWTNLWLETDSDLVVRAFKNHAIVPWHLCNRWANCMQIISGMNFLATHIYREGNDCADSLASLGANAVSLIIWNEPPLCIRYSL
jgi:ribonuclease HI